MASSEPACRQDSAMLHCCFKRLSFFAIEHIADAKLNLIHDVLTNTRVSVRPTRAQI